MNDVENNIYTKGGREGEKNSLGLVEKENYYYSFLEGEEFRMKIHRW